MSPAQGEVEGAWLSCAVAQTVKNLVSDLNGDWKPTVTWGSPILGPPYVYIYIHTDNQIEVVRYIYIDV